MPTSGFRSIPNLCTAEQPPGSSGTGVWQCSWLAESPAPLTLTLRPRQRSSRLRLLIFVALRTSWVASTHAALQGCVGAGLGSGANADGDDASGGANQWHAATKALPEEIASAVSATAAESLLMGIFVLVCSIELRGVKAGLVVRQASAPGAASTLSRSVSALAEQAGSGSGANTPRASRVGGHDDAGSIYGLEELGRQISTSAADVQVPCTDIQTGQVCWKERERWQIGPLVMMMILLHVIYPSFPISPQVEVGRIMTFLGFLWSVGPMRCITVVNTEPMHKCRLLVLTVFCFGVHVCIFAMTDTISDLIFPDANAVVDLYTGPRYLHQLLKYLTIRYPERSASFGLWAAWCVVSAVVFASAVWKEFLFRGVYLGGLRTRMPFWAANVTVALIYALAHEPLTLSADGTIRLRIVGLSPLMMGAMWYGYLYHKCNNLIVIVLAHLLFNACLLGLHLSLNELTRS
mmetsp:Transcript_135566/g.377532  ORF Transcript_135566/g.377532 Transcript_135566/m.377532 type:complete len:464 (+) Transcript_135566:41-1432(+)